MHENKKCSDGPADIRPRSAFPIAPYPSTGHSSVGRVVPLYEPPALLTCLRLTRALALSTSRVQHKVHVEDGSHRVDISPTSGSLTLQLTPYTGPVNNPYTIGMPFTPGLCLGMFRACHVCFTFQFKS